MTDDAEIGKPHVIAEAGGPVDETRVTLAFYGETLEPSDITKYLDCQPTDAHRKGDRRSATSSPSRTGAWFLTAEGRAPLGPGELIPQLLSRFPLDGKFWKILRDQYDVQIRIAIHTAGWNRGFDIPQEALALVAATGATLGFDLYFYGDEEPLTEKMQ